MGVVYDGNGKSVRVRAKGKGGCVVRSFVAATATAPCLGVCCAERTFILTASCNLTVNKRMPMGRVHRGWLMGCLKGSTPLAWRMAKQAVGVQLGGDMFQGGVDGQEPVQEHQDTWCN